MFSQIAFWLCICKLHILFQFDYLPSCNLFCRPYVLHNIFQNIQVFFSLCRWCFSFSLSMTKRPSSSSSSKDVVVVVIRRLAVVLHDDCMACGLPLPLAIWGRKCAFALRSRWPPLCGGEWTCFIWYWDALSSLDNSQPVRPSSLVAKKKESTTPQIALLKLLGECNEFNAAQESWDCEW